MKEVQEDIGRLKEWLLKQPHLPKAIDENILSAFVHGAKSLEIAKQKLEAFFTWRTHLSSNYSFFNIRNPADSYFKQCSKAGILFFLPKTTPEGYRVLFSGISEEFNELFDHDQTLAVFQLTLELSMALWPDMKGIFVVWDVKAFSASYAARMSFPTMETTMRYFQDCYPFKMKGAVLLNTPAMMETAYNSIFKPFLNEKIKNRVTITRENHTCLTKYLPGDILPEDYGGKEKSSSELYDGWLKFLEEKKDWLQQNSLLVADETKRPPASKRIFGVDGTFRSLAID